MVVIQRLGPDDARRLRKVRLTALLDAPDAFGSTYQEAVARALDAWREQVCTLPTFVAVIGGFDCGIVRAAADAEDAGTAYLISMWVAPTARGKGVGEQLIDTILSWARAEGYARVLLDVGQTNAAARALYARKGFRPTGKTSRFPPSREHIVEQQMAIEL